MCDGHWIHPSLPQRAPLQVSHCHKSTDRIGWLTVLFWNVLHLYVMQGFSWDGLDDTSIIHVELLYCGS